MKTRAIGKDILCRPVAVEVRGDKVFCRKRQRGRRSAALFILQRGKERPDLPKGVLPGREAHGGDNSGKRSGVFRIEDLRRYQIPSFGGIDPHRNDRIQIERAAHFPDKGAVFLRSVLEEGACLFSVKNRAPLGVVQALRKLGDELRPVGPERYESKMDLLRRDPRPVALLRLFELLPHHSRGRDVSYSRYLGVSHLFFNMPDHHAGHGMKDFLAVSPDPKDHAGQESVLFSERYRELVSLHGRHVALHLGKVSEDGRSEVVHGIELIQAERLLGPTERGGENESAEQ